MQQPGGEVWFVDTEWGFRGSRVDQESAWEPVVLCVVGLRSKSRLSFWGRDPLLRAFFAAHAGDTFVAHNAVAEMKYLLRLGVPLPSNWFDTFVAWRYLTNRPNDLEAGLAIVLGRLGLHGLVPAEKKSLQMKCLNLEFVQGDAADRKEITDYCFSDCDGCAALYGHVLSRVLAAKMSHWVEYLKAAARTELRGIPYDVPEYHRIQGMRSVIKVTLIGDANATWPVFEGESFKRKSFFDWCRSEGIVWPVRRDKKSGKLGRSLDKDAMKDMEARHPFIAEIRQVRKTLNQFAGRSLTVDAVSGRHYYSTNAFRSVTGRNQPKNFVFSGPKWLRYLIVPESPDHVLVYVDFTAQEFGLAAALSGDAAMREVYEADDSHMAFAIRAGAAPRGATKLTHPGIRKQYKTVNLGMQYGQTGFGIAQRLGIRRAAADELVDGHKALFPDFWRWSERTVQGAYDREWIETPCGWRSGVPFPGNERTWMNWPMQAAGGDIMRLTITYLDRQNVRVLAPVHDGFLLSCRRNQLGDLRQAVDFACSSAVEHVIPGFPMRWDFTVYQNRFEDEDGLPLWNKLQSILGVTDGIEE